MKNSRIIASECGNGYSITLRGFGNPQALQGEHLFHPLAQTACCQLVISLQKPRQLLQSFLSFFGGLHLPGSPHQVESLAVLLLGQFVEDATYLVIATPLHGLIAAEHLLDGRSQGLGSIDDEQVLAVHRQTVAPQMRQQTLDQGGVLGGS